jgi:hypothetical protein
MVWGAIEFHHILICRLLIGLNDGKKVILT